jgi:hypothetical protein
MSHAYIGRFFRDGVCELRHGNLKIYKCRFKTFQITFFRFLEKAWIQSYDLELLRQRCKNMYNGTSRQESFQRKEKTLSYIYILWKHTLS